MPAKKLRIAPLTESSLVDLESLFGCSEVASRCWCMWFLIAVKAFHAAGEAGNREAFRELMSASDYPLGLLAYRGKEAVGWCAVGPRSRYARAIKTPTYKGRDAAEDDSVWLAPCFYVREEDRQVGVTAALLQAAVELAKANGAAAIDGFPFVSTGKRRSGGDLQVGFESVFGDCGFEVVGEPSANRRLMRRELG